MEVARGIPEKIQQRATEVLRAFIGGKVHAKKLHSGYISMNVGLRHRLICKRPAQRQQPQSWQLVTHETYNRHVGHRKYRIKE